jgi:RNA polymerase sigma-70 factor (ECF subfamily)
MVNDDTGMSAVDEGLADAWRAHRSELVAQANRTLRDERAAEDVVQDAFRRLHDSGAIDDIDDVGAWLSVVVRRLCLNSLRSAYARREVVADDVGDLVTVSIDPADRVTLDDEVQFALAVVLHRLSPAERTAFLLHDVFGFPFDAIAAIVGRTPAACRKLASRARRAVRSEPPTTTAVQVEPAEHHAVVKRFIAACAGGDIAELMAVLDPDVDGHAELIGFGPIADLAGRPAVAQRLIGMFGPGTGTEMALVTVETEAAVVAYANGLVAALIRLDVDGDNITHLRSFVLAPGSRTASRNVGR